MKIGKKEIGFDNPTYIVAEAGINHNGDIDIAKKMIEKAAQIGADAIKFQTIIPEELFSKSINPEFFEMSKSWYFTKKQHNELIKHAKKYKIHFFSTPVGKKSAGILLDLKVKPIKIASGELTNHAMIQKIAKTKTPMIVSTGMSTILEIMSAIEIIQKENCPFCILHCNAAYPTPIEETNLINIKYFYDLFRVPIGFSDHTIGNEASLAATALGACIIEKHFTLDKNLPGPDQKLSADVNEFKNLVDQIRIIEKTKGEIRKGPTNSEKKFRKLMRKSIGINKNLKPGTKLTRSLLTSIRPGTGIPIEMKEHIIGLKISKPVKKDSLLRWKDLQ